VFFIGDVFSTLELMRFSTLGMRFQGGGIAEYAEGVG
jgi:hypothetical protein